MTDQPDHMNHPDPFEELAALFLTAPDATPPSAAAGSIVELVVVGSLPVRASLWLRPYADAVARGAGPTALVCLDEEQPSIQLLRAPQELASRRWPTLASAIAGLGPHISAWIIRPAYHVTSRQMVDAATDRVTILSSVNDSAIVKAYQEIKQLSAAVTPGKPDLKLGVAVLGSDLATAERFHRHLGTTTSSFLSFDLALVACVPRMEATIRSTERMAFSEQPYPTLETVLSWIRHSMGRLGSEPPAAGPEEGTAEAPGPSPSAPRSVKLAPKPRVEVEPKPRTGTREPDDHGAPLPLATYIDDVTPLDVCCPGHEQLELAVDAAGRLHVIAHEQEMRWLHVVAAWAGAHAEIIGRSCPGHWIDAAAVPVLHVFTDRPASLGDLHGCDLRLHVLTPVTVDGRRGWYHAPLNADVH